MGNFLYETKFFYMRKYIKLFEEKFESWEILSMTYEQINDAIGNELVEGINSESDNEYLKFIIEWGGDDVDPKYYYSYSKDGYENTYSLLHLAIANNRLGFVKQMLNDSKIDIFDITNCTEEYDDMGYDTEEEYYIEFIESIKSIWNEIKKQPQFDSIISKIKDLEYDKENDIYTLKADRLEDLKVLWNLENNRHYDDSILTKILSEDRYGYSDQLYGYNSDYESYMIDELNMGGISFLKNIIEKNKGLIEDYEDYDFEDDGDLKSFLRNSDSDIADEIKRELALTYSISTADNYVEELFQHFLSDASYFLKGMYNKNEDFKYSNGVYVLKNIDIKWVVNVFCTLSLNSKDVSFLDRLVIPEDELIEYDLSNFDYWSPSFNSDYFTEMFVERIKDLSDIDTTGIEYKKM
jgi:hypothetical protein